MPEGDVNLPRRRHGKQKAKNKLDFPTTWVLSKNPKGIRFIEDEEGNIIAFPVVPFDPSNNPIQPYAVESNTQPVQKVTIFAGGSQALITGSQVDAASNAIGALNVATYSKLFNEATWDRPRNNVETTVFTSAARTSTANSLDQTNYNARGVRLILDISAVSGTTPTLDVKIQSKDSISANYVDIPSAAFAQKTATGTDDLVIYPGVVASANRSLSQVMSRTWRAVATIAGTTPSFTFSLSAAHVV